MCEKEKTDGKPCDGAADRRPCGWRDRAGVHLASSVVPQTKVPVSCAKTANYNSNRSNTSLTVCCENRHAFFLHFQNSLVIVIMEGINKKRKNNPFHSAFFLS